MSQEPSLPLLRAFCFVPSKSYTPCYIAHMFTRKLTNNSHGRGGAGNITETHPKEHHHHGLGDLIHLPIHKDAHKQANGGERPIPVGEAQPGPQPKVQGGEFIR